MASTKGEKKGRKAGRAGFTIAGPVTKTRSDGTSEVAPSYTSDELHEVVGKPKKVEANGGSLSPPESRTSLADAIDATYAGTPSGRASGYRVGQSPGSKRGKL